MSNPEPYDDFEPVYGCTVVPEAVFRNVDRKLNLDRRKGKCDAGENVRVLARDRQEAAAGKSWPEEKQQTTYETGWSNEQPTYRKEKSDR